MISLTAVEAARSTAHLHAELCSEQSRLLRYARYLTRDETNARDLVQTALARALSRPHLFKPGTELRAWLFTIVHNEHANHVRRQLREGPKRTLDGLEHSCAVPAGQVRQVEMREVSRGLARLPPDQRQVMTLIAVEGRRYDEVAAMLDVPIGTVRSRLARAREAMRRMLEGDEVTREAMPGNRRCRSPRPDRL
jgi:RNA polymerase sigma-70 factor, ECF subfamily